MLYAMLARRVLKNSVWRKELEDSEKRVLALWNQKQKKRSWNHNNDGSKLKNIESFRRNVSVCNKEKVFEQFSLKQLSAGRHKEIQYVMMSSGSSSKFSIGVFTKNEMKQAAFNTDLFLNLFFGARKKQTLIINASSMGVRVFSNHTLSDTGPRIDIVIALMKKVAPNYKKVFIVGDPIFIKLLAEDSLTAGINWNDHNAYFISGGEWMPESLRDYVHGITGKDAKCPEKGFWAGTYGLTELGYPLFFENAELVAYRAKQRRKISDLDMSSIHPRFATPFYFFFRAKSYYLETEDQGNSMSRLIFTPLDPRRVIPMFRYDTGDLGEILSHDLNLSFQPMPVVKFWGRDENYIVVKGQFIHILDLKEVLFSVHEIVPKISGFFTVKCQGDTALVCIQLKNGIKHSDVGVKMLELLFNELYPGLISVRFCNYHSMQEQMELDFERKFKTIIR